MRFFVTTQVEDTSTLFVGGSNTIGLVAPAKDFYDYTREWLLNYKSDNPSMVANGGTPTWYRAIRIADIIAASPTHVFIDSVNDGMYHGSLASDRTNGWWTASEAFIVRLRTVLPNAKLIHIGLEPVDEWGDDANDANKVVWNNICDKHGILNLRFDEWLTAVLGHTPTEVENDLYHDGAHFTELGHEEIWNMIENSINLLYPFPGAGWTGDLADYQPYVYDDVADWIGDPIIRTGVDNDGETGTGWSTSGTARLSSTADDTIEWTGTMTAFGLDVVTNTCEFAYSIDGGAYTNVSHSSANSNIRPLYATTRGEHTITIKVISGTVEINRFLAI